MVDRGWEGPALEAFWLWSWAGGSVQTFCVTLWEFSSGAEL